MRKNIFWVLSLLFNVVNAVEPVPVTVATWAQVATKVQEVATTFSAAAGAYVPDAIANIYDKNSELIKYSAAGIALLCVAYTFYKKYCPLKQRASCCKKN